MRRFGPQRHQNYGQQEGQDGTSYQHKCNGEKKHIFNIFEVRKMFKL